MSVKSEDTSESWSFVSSSEERAQMILSEEFDDAQFYTYERRLSKSYWKFWRLFVDDLKSLREIGISGYLEFYLFKSVDSQNLTTTAKISTAEKLARVDLELGTPIEKLAFYCCAFSPTGKVIKR